MHGAGLGLILRVIIFSEKKGEEDFPLASGGTNGHREDAVERRLVGSGLTGRK